MKKSLLFSFVIGVCVFMFASASDAQALSLTWKDYAIKTNTEQEQVNNVEKKGLTLKWWKSPSFSSQKTESININKYSSDNKTVGNNISFWSRLFALNTKGNVPTPTQTPTLTPTLDSESTIPVKVYDVDWELKITKVSEEGKTKVEGIWGKTHCKDFLVYFGYFDKASISRDDIYGTGFYLYDGDNDGKTDKISYLQYFPQNNYGCKSCRPFLMLKSGTRSNYIGQIYSDFVNKNDSNLFVDTDIYIMGIMNNDGLSQIFGLLYENKVHIYGVYRSLEINGNCPGKPDNLQNYQYVYGRKKTGDTSYTISKVKGFVYYDSNSVSEVVDPIGLFLQGEDLSSSPTPTPTPTPTPIPKCKYWFCYIRRWDDGISYTDR